MNKLPFYKFDAICPKCGENGASTVYHGPISHYGSDRVDPEYLLRRCDNCHYEWKEETLDAKDKELK